MDSYTLAFSVSNLGPKTFQKAISEFGSSEKAWQAGKREFAAIGIALKTYETFDAFRSSFNIAKYTWQLEKQSVRFVSFFDKLYPESLRKIENPPIGLFAKGNVKLLDPSHSFGMTIGAVGTRKVTQYGRDVTEFLVEDLVKSGACIVSGLALGVDAIAHRTTIQNNGGAIAVLACGVDCCTPSENYSLYLDILKKNGLIVSEYPLSLPPNKGTFLARNRIVAALSDGLLITEAAEGSGSLITADYALKFGKKVFAVPGPITSKMSDGSLKLLKNGAKLVSNVEDIFEELSIENRVLRKKEKIKNLKLSKEEGKIVLLLENEEMTIDELSKNLKLPVSKIFIAISNLELKGIVKNSGGKISTVR